MRSLSSLLLGDLMYNFWATLWLMLKMFEVSWCPRKRKLLLWQEFWNGNSSRSCQWDSFSVDIAWLRNVLFTGKTLNPSENWEAIHGCSKRYPLGECFSALWAPPQTGGFGATLGEGWKLCHFHTSRYRMTPRFPDQRADSSFSLLRQKHLGVFGEDSSCSLVGEF